MSVQSEQPWRDKERLEELYWEQGLCPAEMEDILGCTERTIWTWIRKTGMETRRPGRRTNPWATYDTDSDGYERWQNRAGRDRNKQVYVHRLLAVAEYGLESVANHHIHHKNGIRWDNRPENIVLMTHEEHNRHHAIERDFGGLIDGKSGWEIHKEQTQKSSEERETASADNGGIDE